MKPPSFLIDSSQSPQNTNSQTTTLVETPDRSSGFSNAKNDPYLINVHPNLAVAPPLLFPIIHGDHQFSKDLVIIKHDTEEIVNSCDLCRKGFPNGSARKLHMNNFHETYFCRMCDADVGNAFQYSEHLRLIHTTPKKKEKICSEEIGNPCKLCKKGFPNERALKFHRTTFHKTYFCKKCAVDCRNAQQYSEHLRANHYRKVKERICCVCKKEFSLPAYLSRHMRKVHSGVPLKKCPLCSFETYNSPSFELHILSHENKPEFKCTQCDRKYYKESDLKNHMETAHGPGHKCDVCHKVYNDKSYLKRHKKIHGPEPPKFTNKIYECDFCKKTMVGHTNMKRHIFTHLGMVKMHCCEICGFKTAYRDWLEKHLKAHTGEKSCICDICGKTFLRLQLLTVHKRVHTGEKPYACDLCDKCFTQRSTLIVHKRGHTGEKPYPCEKCEKRFVTKTLMKTHVAKKH